MHTHSPPVQTQHTLDNLHLLEPSIFHSVLLSASDGASESLSLFEFCLWFCTSTGTAKLPSALLCCALSWEAHRLLKGCIQRTVDFKCAAKCWVGGWGADQPSITSLSLTNTGWFGWKWMCSQVAITSGVYTVCSSWFEVLGLVLVVLHGRAPAFSGNAVVSCCIAWINVCAALMKAAYVVRKFVSLWQQLTVIVGGRGSTEQRQWTRKSSLLNTCVHSTRHPAGWT